MTTTASRSPRLKLAPPFQATVLLRKARAGTYTVQAASTAANPRAPDEQLPDHLHDRADDKVDFFVEGDFGKERRVREPDPGPVANGIPEIRRLRAAARR